MSTSGSATRIVNYSVSFAAAGVAEAPAAVPVPAAVWLFGTALAGFIGLNRRKTV
jgi:hypothetical protein